MSTRAGGGRHRRGESSGSQEGPLATVPAVTGVVMVRPSAQRSSGAGGSDAAPEPAPAVNTGRGLLRPRSVRAKVVSLLMVPVVALMGLWGLAMVTVAGDALTVQQVSRIQAQVRVPLDRTVAALEAERSAVVRSLADQKPRTLTAPAGATAGLGSEESATDAAIGSVRSGVRSAQVEIAGLPSVASRTSALANDFAGLAALRTAAATGRIQPVDAYAAYSGAVSDAQAVQSTLDSEHAAHTASTGVVAGAWLGLVAIVVSLLISVRIGQALVTELVVLRDSALDLAGRRLPGAIARLRAGQEVDLAAEAPLPPAGGAGGDEIGQVAEALAVVQHAALEAAVERAEVISGVAGVFRNLARRSQTLVHRQLALLEAMERRVDDPGELEDLFRLDHLATRMQRHAEGLIILSGSPPGRGWRRPVPLMDVVRAAAAEVEDFARVDVRRMPPVAVAGGAVADLTHLVAELVENATAFSPPHSRVVVRGRPVASGCVVEVEDQGLGMGRAALAEANRRIADSRPDDLFESDRLGLYVVSRLARRHGVEVAVRPGAEQGTVAIVMLPAAVLADEDEDEDRPMPELGMPTRAEALADEGAAVGAPAAVMSAAATAAAGTPAPALASAANGQASFGNGHAAIANGRTVIANGHTVIANGQTSTAPRTAGRRDDPSRRTGENGLPRRVRQASLAVQLRSPRSAPPPADPPAGASAPSRDPETVRATMAAFQRGWTRGRGGPDPKENA